MHALLIGIAIGVGVIVGALIACMVIGAAANMAAMKGLNW